MRQGNRGGALVSNTLTDMAQPMTLAELRNHVGKTQSEVGAPMGMAQSNVSMLEARTDVHLSTLRDYVEALGGRLEVVAVVGRERIPIDLG